MVREHARGVLAAAATAALAVTAPACASPAPAFHPGGAVAPTASASLAHFPFPPGNHIEFQTPLPAGPQQAAVVTTDWDFWLALSYAWYTQGKDTHYQQYFAPATNTLRIQVENGVLPYAANHKSWRGTVRFYDTTAQPVPGTQNITVTECVDASQAPDVDAQTGKTVPGTGASFLESDTFSPVGGGRWGLIGLTSNTRECKP